MTQLLHDTKPVHAAGVQRDGVVYVPCVICRAPVDLAAVTEANDAPICHRHFTTELPRD